MAFLLPVIGAVGTAAAGSSALATIGTIAGIGGSVLSAVGSYQQNKSVQVSAKYNARSEEMAAAADRDAASAEAEDRRRRGSAARATALAERGASNVALAGTPLLVDEDIVGEIELDAARTLHRGEAKAIGRENQARLDRASAKSYGRAAPLSAGASLLGGLSRTF